MGILWPSDQATPPAGTVRNNMNKKTYMFTLLSAKACEKENENEFLVNYTPFRHMDPKEMDLRRRKNVHFNELVEFIFIFVIICY